MHVLVRIGIARLDCFCGLLQLRCSLDLFGGLDDFVIEFVVYVFSSSTLTGGKTPIIYFLSLDWLVGLGKLLDRLCSDAVAKVSKCLKILSLFLEHG